MKTAIAKIVLAALMGAAFMAGCIATGIMAPNGDLTESVTALESQIVEIQAVLEGLTIYDQFAANPIDEMAGLEDGQ